MLCQSSGTDCELRGGVLPRLLLFLSQHSVWLVEAVFEFVDRWPTDILRASRFTMTEHCQKPTGTDIQQ